MLTKILSPIRIISATGNLVAVAAVAGFFIMVGLGVRLRPVEQRIGLDRMYRYHKILGLTIALLLIAHALLRTLAFSLQKAGAWSWSFFFYLSLEKPALMLGHAAIYLLIIIVAVAFVGRHRIPFRWWKSVHLLVYPILAIAFTHVLLEANRRSWGPEGIALSVLLAGPLLALYSYRIAYAVRRDRGCTWQVSNVIVETGDTNTLVVSRLQGPGRFGARKAGQFAIIRVREGNKWSEPHPFTIASAPGSPDLSFTIKSAGRFTSAIPSLRPGAPVLCEGPYGVFNVDFSSEPEIVMICGGVGITPFLSNIRHAVGIGTNTRITLICGNRSTEDIIALEELKAAVERIPLRVVHVLSKPPHDGLPQSSEGIIFESGHIDEELLTKHIPSSGASFYLCGPPRMQEAVLLALKNGLGVPGSAVKRELFFY